MRVKFTKGSAPNAEELLLKAKLETDILLKLKQSRSKIKNHQGRILRALKDLR